MVSEWRRKVCQQKFTETTPLSLSKDFSSTTRETNYKKWKISCLPRIYTDDIFTYNPTFLTITSSGSTAECCGDYLGVYKVAGSHNNCPYYRQVDTLRSKYYKQRHIYKYSSEGWAVGGPGLGRVLLWNNSNTDVVPMTGWGFFDERRAPLSSGRSLASLRQVTI